MSEEQEEPLPSPDIHFEPIVKLPLIESKPLEEDEEELVKLRAKLFRYDSAETPHEWKERGTGEVKILKHKQTKVVRLLMRRDKTLKICANHLVQPNMELKANCGSDRAWVWSTMADYADEIASPELLAIRFANVENAQKFKTAFEVGQRVVPQLIDTTETKDDELTKKLSDLKVKDSVEKDEEEKETDTSAAGDSDKSQREDETDEANATDDCKDSETGEKPPKSVSAND